VPRINRQLKERIARFSKRLVSTTHSNSPAGSCLSKDQLLSFSLRLVIYFCHNVARTDVFMHRFQYACHAPLFRFHPHMYSSNRPPLGPLPGKELKPDVPSTLRPHTLPTRTIQTLCPCWLLQVTFGPCSYSQSACKLPILSPFDPRLHIPSSFACHCRLTCCCTV